MPIPNSISNISMIARLLPIYLLTLQQINRSNYLPIIDRAIEDVLREVKLSNVQLMVHGCLASNFEIVESIYKTVVRVVPASYVSLNDSILEELPSFAVSRATLILYFYIAKGPPDLRQREDIVRAIASNDSRPKVLLITMLEEENSDFEALFNRAWDARFIDVTILEMSKLDGREVAMKIHRHNPFTNAYDQQPYVPGIEWFPNKLRNLHGYPLMVAKMKRPDFIWLPKNSTTKEPDVEIAKALASTMNFTFVLQHVDKNVFEQVKIREIDIVVTAISLFVVGKLEKIDYSLPLDFELWCPVVPITYRYNSMKYRALIGIVINCIVVLVFWGISRLLKFDSHSWQPLRIFALLISSTISLKLRGTKERFVFFNVMMASSMFSTALYSDLTTVSMRNRIQTDYKSYKELDESGLMPAVYDVLMNVTFLGDDESFLSLKRKAISIGRIGDCLVYLLRHRNITCFVPSNAANIAINEEARRGSVAMKICKELCYAKPPVAYFMSKHTPYRDRIVEIIMRLHIAGIWRKWHLDYIGKSSMKRPRDVKVNSLYNSSVTWNLLFILGGGFSVSLLIFLGEILIHGINGNGKKARRF
ncbi:uncharacterized protein LOC143221089 [Lasioglossum baleicum]|uniref:uncharacterized protein LOC143221089 n=1 Tax=Lasioglossum baleicum TaxID=434251 RepID=UPI003FCC4E7B